MMTWRCLKMTWYLIASDDVDDDHHISHGDQPTWLWKSEEYVIIHSVPESPITDESDGEVTESHHNVCEDHTFPHRLLRRFLRRRRYGGLNFENNIMAGVSKCDITQCAEESENFPDGRRRSVSVVHVWNFPLVYRCTPSYGGVTQRHDGGG